MALKDFIAKKKAAKTSTPKKESEVAFEVFRGPKGDKGDPGITEVKYQELPDDLVTKKELGKILKSAMPVVAGIVDAPRTGSQYARCNGSWQVVTGGEGGGGSWGAITGTLSAQTDLQAAIDGKAAVGHNHDASYATLGHNHDASYSAIGHNHDSSYAALSHAHAVSDVTGLAATLANKSDVGHSHTTSNITDFDEAVQDVIGTKVVAGTGISIGYNDTTGETTVTATGGGSYTDEQAQDAVGTILVDSATVDFTYSDATPSITAAVVDDSITFAKMQNIATARFVGRTTAATGDPEELTGTQATAMLDAFTSGAKGLAPASGGGTTNFLRADGTWAAPSGGGSMGVLCVPWVATGSGSSTLTNHPNSEQSFANTPANSRKLIPLTGYTQARIYMRTTVGTTSPNSPRLYAKYSTSYGGAYNDLGDGTNPTLSLTSIASVDTGWFDIVSGAAGDVYVDIMQNGGDGVADPVVVTLLMYFK